MAPLHIACGNAKHDAVALLVNRGADVLAENNVRTMISLIDLQDLDLFRLEGERKRRKFSRDNLLHDAVEREQDPLSESSMALRQIASTRLRWLLSTIMSYVIGRKDTAWDGWGLGARARSGPSRETVEYSRTLAFARSNRALSLRGGLGHCLEPWLCVCVLLLRGKFCGGVVSGYARPSALVCNDLCGRLSGWGEHCNPLESFTCYARCVQWGALIIQYLMTQLLHQRDCFQPSAQIFVESAWN